MLAWLSVWSKVQTCIWPSCCHCHSLSLALVKSRLVLPFWYRLTRVVPEKRTVKRVCLCVCVVVLDVAQRSRSYSYEIDLYTPTNRTDWLVDRCDRVGPLIGLVVTAIGTGGIKPCVSAFGGDQFVPGQVSNDISATGGSPGAAACSSSKRHIANDRCRIVSCTSQKSEAFMRTESPCSNPSSSVAVIPSVS